MGKTFIVILLGLNLVSCTQKSPQSLISSNKPYTHLVDTVNLTNNFYDNTESYELNVPAIIVEGEIDNPGIVNFSSLPKHSVFVKETLPDSAGGNKFVRNFMSCRSGRLQVCNILSRAI